MAIGFPALAGFTVFYLLPFIRALGYSFRADSFSRRFVFLENYINVLGNGYYQLALKNTFLFSVISVVCLTALSLLLSLGLARMGKRFRFIRDFLVAPMILPTASVVFAWQTLFRTGLYDETARLMAASGGEFLTILPLYLLYLWKHAGLSIILISAAIAGLQPELLEAAAMDGAKGGRMFRSVILPMITPALLFVVVLSFVNALKNFRESYLYFWTGYPPDAAYTVQYYMNNHFYKLNYPNLATGSVIFTGIIVMILLVMYRLENRFNAQIY
jgi:multiple sugar transport system permease protein